MKLPIYLDHQATTPVDPQVLDAMMPYFTEKFGNAASRNHAFGWEAEEAVEAARVQIANLIGASPKEIIFTSGATESDNIALKGAFEMYAEKGTHIITTAIEHKAVLDSASRVEQLGGKVTYVPVNKEGVVDPDDVKKAITDKTILISVMGANNEVGTIQPITEIGALAHEHEILFHCDAAQAAGKFALDVNEMNIDIMSLSGHKMYGPKGIGAMYVRRRNPRVRLTPVIHGGGHERGMRSGTLNVPAIVGFGKACEICQQEMDTENVRMKALRDKLKDLILTELDEVYINGSLEHRLSTNLNLSFAFVEGEALMMGMKDIAVSSGSACTSASLEPSYVLKALGVGDDLAHSSIRFGVGRFNTEEEIEYVARQVVDSVKRLRELSPLYEMAKEGIDITSVNWSQQ